MKNATATNDSSLETGFFGLLAKCFRMTPEALHQELKIVELMGALKPEQRVLVMSVLASCYCGGCGNVREAGNPCQCDNDE